MDERMIGARLAPRSTMIDTESAGLKFYLNGFPKAGLHLLDLLMRPLALPMQDDMLWNAPWVGMFKGHSWTTNRHDSKHIGYRLGRVQPGRFLKGHLGYDIQLSEMMYYMGIVHIFIYRDLRDVAVSQVHHIMDTQERGGQPLFGHPGKVALNSLGGFDEILTAVIVGTNEWPGIFQRWYEFSDWVFSVHANDLNRVFCVKYEDIMTDPINWASKIIGFTLTRLFETTGQAPVGFPMAQIAEEMWRMSQITQLSPTFRKGGVGGWRDYFKPYHIRQFEAADGRQQHKALGYDD